MLGVKFLVFAISPLLVAAKNPKRGLAFADGSHTADISQATQNGNNLTWVYDWGQNAPSYLKNTGLTYIAMQWGQDGIENFQSLVLAQNAKTIIGFNEPDFSSQSNIPAATAAQLWIKYINPLKSHGIRLGGPAITNAPSGRQWLSDFLNACNGQCVLDFIPIHWYGEGLGNFYNYIWSIHGEFSGYEIWITEFGLTSNVDEDVTSFIQSSTQYLDSLDWVGGYAWFAFFRADSGYHYNLLDVDGKLNAQGHAYVGV